MDEKVKRGTTNWRKQDTRELPPLHMANTLVRTPDEMRNLISDAETYWETQQEIIMEDRRMYAGEQWDYEDEEDRAEDSRPAPVLNQLGVYADYLKGLMDGEQMTASVMARDLPGEDTSGGTFTGEGTGEQMDKAHALEAHLRHLLEDSDFPAQRSDAAHKLITTGMAYLRLYLDYEDGAKDDLTFKLKSVQDQLEVLLDPTYREPDATDASWCAIQTKVDKEVAKARWPGVTDNDLKSHGSLWSPRTKRDDFWIDKENRVRVLEFFQVIEERETRVVMEDGTNLSLKEYEKVAERLMDAAREAGTQVPPPVTREFCFNRVYMSQWVGEKMLTGPTLLPYDCLPIFPAFGRAKHQGDRMCYFSVIHEATDAQRMLNYAAASIMSQSSRSGSAPWVAAPDAIAGHEDQYGDPSNQDQVFYYNPHTAGGRQLPPPQRQRALQADPVSIEAFSLAKASLSDIIGIDEAGLGRNSNAVSARSSEVRIQAQQQNFQIYADSLSRAVERACEAIVRAIPKVYDDDRYIRVKLKDGRKDWVRINSDIVTDPQTGESIMMNGVTTQAHMNVRVKAVPSDETVRQSKMRLIAELGKSSPAMSEALSPHMARYADDRLGDEVADAMISRLPLNALTPEQMERRVHMEVEAAKAGELIKLKVAEVQMQAAEMREQMGIQPEGPSGEEALAQAKVQEVQARTQKEVAQTETQTVLRDAKTRNIAAEGMRAEQKDQAALEGQLLENQKALRDLIEKFDDKVEDAVNRALLRREQVTQETDDE